MKRLILVALFILLTLCACGQVVPPEEPATEATTVTQATTTQAPATAYLLPIVEGPASYKDAPAAYKPVLDDLYTINCWLSEYGIESLADLEDGVKWYEPGRLRYADHFFDAWNKCATGYTVLDINRDGVKELLLLGTPGENGTYLYTIYTLKDGEPVWLVTYTPRWDGHLAVDGTIHVISHGGSFSGSEDIYRLKPYAAELTLVGGHEFENGRYNEEKDVYTADDTYYKMSGEEKILISEKEYRALAAEYADYETSPMKLNYTAIVP